MAYVDEYLVSGEFLHLMSRDAWATLRTPVSAALRGSRPDAGPLVEIGAGSGLGTRVLADVVPGAQIIVTEPSSTLRAVLLARVVDDPDLRSRVTVLDADALAVDLPARVGGVLAMNMIGHLAPAERTLFWAKVGQRLAPGAPLVVNLQPPYEPIAVPESEFASVSVGRHRYQGSGEATPVGDEVLRWRMNYHVLDHVDRVVREEVVDYRWHVLSPTALEAELADAGFTVTPGESGVFRATVRSRPLSPATRRTT